MAEANFQRTKLFTLDRCLHLLEEALAHGKSRIDAPLGSRLRTLLGEADLVPDSAPEALPAADLATGALPTVERRA